MFSVVVPLIFFVAAITYAFCVNFVPSYRGPVDSLAAAKIGIQNNGSDEERVSDLDAEKGGAHTSEHVSSIENKEVRGL